MKCYRFACLHMGLRVQSPAYACKCIMACIVLHNIATKNHDYIETEQGRQLDEADTNEANDEEIVEQSEWQATNAGRIFRNAVANKYF